MVYYRMDVLGRGSELEQSAIRVVKGCPCFKVFGDERLCVNNDDILEVEVMEIDPSIFAIHKDKESIAQELAQDENVCYASIYINYPDNKVYCISQGWTLKIHGKDVPGNDLEDALQFLSTKSDESAEICSECLYKFILTLADTFADLMTRKEKTDEVKRYVDKFSLMIAVKLSQMDELMTSIGTEEDVDKGVDHFSFLREYLVQLLDQQQKWRKLHHQLEASDEDKWLIDLVKMREKLARLEFQFYSQTLQLRDINDFHLLIRMLKHVLESSTEILKLNEKIHEMIRSKDFLEKAQVDERLRYLKSYAEKSRAIEHNFGNILQILSRL